MQDPGGYPKPVLLPAARDWNPAKELELEAIDNPMSNGTLGDARVAVRVKGPTEFRETILVQPVRLPQLPGLDGATIRMFRFDDRAQSLVPVWNSGINLGLGFLWTRIRRPETVYCRSASHATGSCDKAVATPSRPARR